jgi:hypothetical protein
MGKRAPLALPEGSVRAIIALAIIGTVCGMTALGKTVPEFLIRGFELALYGYGLVRAAQWQKDPPPPPPPPPAADPAPADPAPAPDA